MVVLLCLCLTNFDCDDFLDVKSLLFGFLIEFSSLTGSVTFWSVLVLFGLIEMVPAVFLLVFYL